MSNKAILSVLAAVGILTSGTSTQAEVVIQTVTVGNPGNPDDTHGSGYGGLDYIY